MDKTGRRAEATSSSEEGVEGPARSGGHEAEISAGCRAPTRSPVAGQAAQKRSRLSTLAQIGEDWLYLALLGIIIALLSFSMDSIITLFLNTRLWLSAETRDHNLLVQYAAWCATPILLVTFSTGFVHLCSPTVSSGPSEGPSSRRPPPPPPPPPPPTTNHPP